MCDSVTILSTTGGVKFDADGRHMLRSKREHGTVFEAVLRMNNTEYEQVVWTAQTLLVPEGVEVYFNGNPIPHREPSKVVRDTLPTVIADEEGVLKPTRRLTDIRIVPLREGERAYIYEMGIPVVETDCKWHIDVQQKVPLNMDRDNVPPAYLQQLRTIVTNAMRDEISADDANETWVRAATNDDRCAPETIKRVLDLRFGTKRVGFDPSDREANNIAVSQGFTVVPARAMSAQEWKNAKAAGAILPAGQVTPSPKPFSETGDPLTIIPENEWTPDMRAVVRYLVYIGGRLLNRTVRAEVANDIHWPFSATFGHGSLTLNIGRLGRAWFNLITNREEINRLALHEFAHERVQNHLSRDMLDEICRLGAGLLELGLAEPGIFDPAHWRE